MAKRIKESDPEVNNYTLDAAGQLRYVHVDETGNQSVFVITQEMFKQHISNITEKDDDYEFDGEDHAYMAYGMATVNQEMDIDESWGNLPVDEAENGL